MAEEVQIPGAKVKIRSVWAPALLPFITLAIYLFFWWYYINREMAEYGKAKGSNELGDSPGKSVLAITLGALIIVPWVLSTINTFRRVQTAQKDGRSRAAQRLDRAHPHRRPLAGVRMRTCRAG